MWFCYSLPSLDSYAFSLGPRCVSVALRFVCEEENMSGVLDETPPGLPSPLFCVFAEENEFILYATRKSIHRYDLASGATEQLPLSGLRAAVALDFDYEHNCLYWSDLALDVIQVSQPLVWSLGSAL